ncbi:aldo/keto reductase [Stackebrandtia nassauensis]|uniref:Aldo/keto reductase n=1 Tax=Stackebrandtia nassauensis (strain DSM 44728 / CIP 108903 / NRRL B-16338 / NBRC 102104 / LLR-40K-21) TaxID=446470 RepID=D3PUE0_STANL|nr:aldo/keto reductase [Stackebrandtia nassauensis]ADD42953.1 aldo/keto reductase [Stackebrandtia nassauensis DSM 44728]
METYRLAGTDLTVSKLCLGAMALGAVQDERTSFAILDRFVEAGGTFIDTANNYMFWLDGHTGDESELMLGRWLAARGNREDVVVASKVGWRPTTVGGGLDDAEHLTAQRIGAAIDESLARLGTDYLDLYWTHRDDRDVGLAETVAGMAATVTAGKARAIGASNHTAWRVSEARALAPDTVRYVAMQNRYSYLQPRPGVKLAESGHVHATSDTLDFVAATEDMALLTYTALLYGSYTRDDKPLSPQYVHPGTEARLQVLDEVATETGATRNQVVLAWLCGHPGPVIPLVGVSSVSQLDEVIDGVNLKLSAEQWRRLSDAA